jgi:hypothetical protein
MLLLVGTASSYGPVSTPTWVVSGGSLGEGGVVASVAVSGSTAYVGGNFDWVGPPTGSFVGLAQGTGALVSPWPAVGGNVYAVASDSAGGFFIGGSFRSIGTRHADNIAHINSDGTLDTSWTGGTDGTVYALAVSGDTVYAGGDFTDAGGSPHVDLAAFSKANGAVVAGFVEGDSAATAFVAALELSGSTLYVGGLFGELDNVEHVNLGAIDTATGNVKAWSPSTDDTVLALTSMGTTVYAGGLFELANVDTEEIDVDFAAAFDAGTGDVVTTWLPEPSGPIFAMKASGSVVYVGGNFERVGAEDLEFLAAVRADTGVPTTWNPEVDGDVYTIAVPAPGSTVYVGGLFQQVGNLRRDNVAAIDATTADATSFESVVGGEVDAVAVSGTTVGVGGEFRTAGGGGGTTPAPLPRSNLAAIDLTTGLATGWSPVVDDSVQTLVVSGTTVYVGGDFTGAAGVQNNRHRLAAFTTGGVLLPWDPGVHNGQVLALTVLGPAVYAGGTFTLVSRDPNSTPPNQPITRNRVAAFDAHGVGNGLGDLKSWFPNPNGPVFALDAVGSTIYLGGSFTRLRDPGGVARNRLAAVPADPNGPGIPTAWDPNANGSVFALAHVDSTVYAGGLFTAVRGTIARNGVAAFPAVGNGVPTSWAPQLLFGPSTTGDVYALAPSASIMYLSGVFHTVGGHSSPSVAAVSLATGAPLTSWQPAANSLVQTIALAPQGLVLGGPFTALGYPPGGTEFAPEETGATYRGGFGLVRALADAPSVTATPGNGEVTVSFTPPAYNGGDSITSYTLTVSPGTVINDAVSPTTVTGLTNGTSYTFSVTATTSAGIGEAGVATATPRTVPDAPTGVTAVAGENTMTISFSPPASNGGAPITLYTVTASPGGNTASGTGSPIVMTGLVNDTTYTFTVTATNAAGDGPPSAPSDPVTARSAGRPHPNPPDPAPPRPPVPPLPPAQPRPPLPTP